jgi:ubiquinone/menaquinone biosynthesis C-methylase UbiE
LSVGDGIAAYDVPERIASYEADMDIMHPNRHKMVQIAVGILPFDRREALRVLDLGSGTGFFTKRLLDTFPNARVIAVDGAAAMMTVASERLGGQSDRVSFRTGDFRELDTLLSPGERGHLVISSYALHHVERSAKVAIVRRCAEFLEADGWFVNADVIVGATPVVEARYQKLRLAGIVSRAAPEDPRFGNPERARTFLDELEATEGDQPLSLKEDLAVLSAAGLRHVDVFWSEYREAVTGGMK